MKKAGRSIDWVNVLFLTLSPLLAVVGGVWYTQRFGIHFGEIALFVAMFFATGLSITAGYHRHFAHASYRAHPALRIVYLIFGSCALQNSALNWAADHRLHHRYTDTDKDPYNAGQGFWYSHIGWIFYQTPKDRDFSVVSDLLADRWVRFQHRYNVRIGFIVGVGIPLLVGIATHHVLGMLLWGALIRVVFVHHATFFINSLAHMSGSQPYSRADSSRDSWWLALLTNGEGYHNFHHRFPSDYRNGLRWYQWDPTKWLIAGLQGIGMTARLHRIPPQLILRARVEVEALDAEKRLQALPNAVGPSWRERFESAKAGFERAISEWGETRANYRESAKSAFRDSDLLKRQWKAKLIEYEAGLTEARDQWRETLRSLYRSPLSNV